jgi:cytochrome c oxidase assembly protein subunit 11
MTTPDFEAMARRNQRTGLIVMAVVTAMIFLSFASVPLYRLFCQATGLGGRAVAATSAPTETRDRMLQINFYADTDAGLPWEFKPEAHSVKIQVGQQGLTAYTAKNEGPEAITGTAVFSVTPEKAGKYFHKTQCFCFGEQTLKAGEAVNMPVVFYVDPGFADDPDMDGITTITLSYTFYRAASDALTSALDAMAGGRSGPVAGSR